MYSQDLKSTVRAMSGLLVGICLLSILAGAQQLPSWQEDVRRCVQAQDWSTAIAIVDREVARAPKDMDVRAWRARLLTWSGKLAEAELEYQVILTAVPNDPDDWMGVAALYSCEGRTKEALQAL